MSGFSWAIIDSLDDIFAFPGGVPSHCIPAATRWLPNRGDTHNRVAIGKGRRETFGHGRVRESIIGYMYARRSLRHENPSLFSEVKALTEGRMGALGWHFLVDGETRDTHQ